MSAQIVRKIRENLYGSIGLSKLEDQVLGHPAFQRLRRVKQTAFLSFVFPGATHTRFEHSLGVMHVVGNAWRRMEENQARLRVVCERYKNFPLVEKKKTQVENHGTLFESFDKAKSLFSDKYVYQALRLAAMLHDVGHPPFSHSGEIFLPSHQALIKENAHLPSYISEYFTSMSRKAKSASHEDYTIMLIEYILRDIDSDIDPRDVISIIAPKIRPATNSPLQRNNLYLLCHQLISGEIDVDRMDYLRRDSQESGVVYGVFDIERILDSLSLYYDSVTDSLQLAIRYSGLAAFEDFLRARQSMYLQLYAHKTTVAADVMLNWIRRQLPAFFLPAYVLDYVKIDEWNLEEHLSNFVALQKDGQEKFRILATMSDLFSQRNLWKRIFEISNQNNPDPDEMTWAKKILSAKNIAFEEVSFRISLTKFKKREVGERSKNEIRLIKKDNFQFPRVLPIEDYSRIISDETSIFIARIYVDMGSVEQKFVEDLSCGAVFDVGL